MSSNTAQEPKKKRRQNVACDPCKLRRIKCDLLELLSNASDAGPSTPARSVEPLHCLVRRNPGVSCTNCLNKAVQCSTEGILNPIRPNKGGRRIEEARRKFGAEGLVNEAQEAPDTDAVMNSNEEYRGRGQYEQDVGTSFGDTGGPANFGRNGMPSAGSLDDTWESLSRPIKHSQDTDAGSIDLLNAILATMKQQPFPDTPQIPQNEAPKSSHPTPLGPPTPDTQREALRRWEELSVNTVQTIANRSARSSAFLPSTPAEPIADLDGHTSHLDTLVPALGRLDIETNQFLPILPAHATERDMTSDRTSSRPPGYQDQLVRHRDVRSPVTSASASVYSGKRYRSADPDSGGSSPATFVNLVKSNERDPWHIWQRPDESGDSIVAWSRKDQVQETLADKALGIELSRHLVTVYFQAVHFSLPVLSPESFYLEWEACGRRSDRMNPAQEALCAVIEAWAARYSDNPAVLGLPYQRAHTAPKVIKADGQFTPGTQARAHWGKARLPVCNALLDRAGRIIDANSIMRRPSVTGLQALSLYNQLMHMSDQGSRVKDQWIQNMMVHATILEQMKLLQMFWTAGDPILTANDSDLDALQVRMKQRRLFWTTAVADSCWAAATGMPPKMPEEELAAGRAWVDEVIDSLPNSTMKILAFFMKIWHRLAVVGREVSTKVTKFNSRKGHIAVTEFIASVQGCWSEIRSIMTELNESSVSLLGACEPGVLGFSPLNYITNMRLCCPFFLLVLHESIRNHLAFRQNLFGSYVAEPDREVQAAGQHGHDLALLNKLHVQSVDVLLYNCRSQMALFKSLLPTGIIQSASIMIRVLIASGQFLAEVPTNEQGYPGNTLGGYDWTWEEKQKLVSICTDALYQIGWAWSDVTEVLEAIHLAMERMTPEPEVLAVYPLTPPPIHVGIQTRRSRELRVEDQGIQSALKFWPPKSIPDIVSLSVHGMFADTPLIPSGVPEADMGTLLHTRPPVYAPSTTSSVAPSAFEASSGMDTSAPSIGVGSSLDDVTGFGFTYPARDAALSGTETHNQTKHAQTQAESLMNEHGLFPPLGPEAARSGQQQMDVGQGGGESSLWELINGGGGDDAVFHTFLQSLGVESLSQ